MIDANEIYWQSGVTLDDVEEMVIKKAYRFHSENKTHTARDLGISIRTLDAKLKKYEGKTDEPTDENTLGHPARPEDN